MNATGKAIAVNLVAMAKEKKKEDLLRRRAETWGGKQLRRYKWRTIVQLSMVALCVVLGFQFYFFIQGVTNENGGQTGMSVLHTTRPTGVDGFLPITGMMGTVDWISNGTLNTIHPAATILFLTFLAISLLFRKAFCSWLCPVGTISEYLAMLGRKIFGRNFKLWNSIDFMLGTLKYVLLFFFVGSIFYMGLEGTHAFLYSDYNHVADIKMGVFFTRLGTVGIVVLGFLIIGSIFVNGLWCRYLCPYGALLGLFTWMSPTKVVRTAGSCIDCGLCDKACPARLPVMSKAKIISVECTGCFDCVASCPVPAALNVERLSIIPRTESKATVGEESIQDIIAYRPISVRKIGIAMCTIFVGVWILAQAMGLWHNSITNEQYRTMIPQMDTYGHPGR